jgi:hypothetical protein
MTYYQQFAIADSHYKVSTNSPQISEKLRHLFAGFKTHTPPESSPIPFEINQSADGRINVFPQAKKPRSYTSVDECISLLELRLVRSAFDKMHFIGIHSGAVVCNGKTILFPGRSGKGKTTLTLGCLLRGGSFLSDEMALIEPNTANAYAFPRVLCNKTDLSLFQALDDQNHLQQPRTTLFLNNSHCISPQAFDNIPQKQPCSIDAIIFPNYQLEHDTTLLPVSPIQSLQKLLKLTYKRTQNPQLLDTLGQIVESVPSFELTMNNLLEAIERVERFAN